MSKICLAACILLCVLLEVRGSPHEAAVQAANAERETAPPFAKAKEPGEKALPDGTDTKSLFSTVQSFVYGLYQEFQNRRQSFANLLMCGNCVSESWDAIMAAVGNVPGLEWAYKPQGSTPGGHSPSFFTAFNQNGVVTGFGGSIVDNKPVVEFVFDHAGMIQHLNSTDAKAKDKMLPGR